MSEESEEKKEKGFMDHLLNVSLVFGFIYVLFVVILFSGSGMFKTLPLDPPEIELDDFDF